MDRKGALWRIVYPIILLVIDPCSNPLRTGLLLHPYGWLTRQLQLAAQVPYASFRNRAVDRGSAAAPGHGLKFIYITFSGRTARDTETQQAP